MLKSFGCTHVDLVQTSHSYTIFVNRRSGKIIDHVSFDFESQITVTELVMHSTLPGWFRCDSFNNFHLFTERIKGEEVT